MGPYNMKNRRTSGWLDVDEELHALAFCESTGRKGMGVVLVTGATDGIGLAAAQQLNRNGHTVLVHGRSPVKVSNVVASLGGGTKGYVADLSLMSEVRRLGGEVATEFQRSKAS